MGISSSLPIPLNSNSYYTIVRHRHSPTPNRLSCLKIKGIMLVGQALPSKKCAAWARRHVWPMTLKPYDLELYQTRHAVARGFSRSLLVVRVHPVQSSTLTAIWCRRSTQSGNATERGCTRTLQIPLSGAAAYNRLDTEIE